ncbi:radical SAM family heme chaperone HemW [Treponema primitia]|uniref:radical SAM family heme chaperone HemW n=1 Tax=Treponema primitia TaxID=88058 RepID=UPI0002554F5E|nr:radical SAM family heme chaperone HemW [Treponema primitia]
MGKEAGVYIHVPFCSGVCDYCDFYSIPVRSDDTRLDQFVDLILQDLEADLIALGISHVPTVYIGGGTPSVLGAARLDRLLEGVGALRPGEFTLEANPESADGELLRVCRDRGVTRLSLGIQSFHEPSRRAVHRVGELALLPERLSLAAEIFDGALSLDLMTGLPFQGEYILQKDIEKALSYEPGHLSLYSLTPEEGTPLAAALEQGTCPLPEDDEADRLWITGRNTLEAAGYAQYEVSNFSQPGKEARHNIRYWRMENWLGLGPGGSGTLIADETGLRRTYKADLDSWLRRDGCAPYTEEALDQPTLIRESILMGFRYLKGPDTALFEKRFHRPLESLIPQTLRRWESRGLLQKKPLGLTKGGLLFLNTFLTEAFAEIDQN